MADVPWLRGQTKADEGRGARHRGSPVWSAVGQAGRQAEVMVRCHHHRLGLQAHSPPRISRATADLFFGRKTEQTDRQTDRERHIQRAFQKHGHESARCMAGV